MRRTCSSTLSTTNKHFLTKHMVMLYLRPRTCACSAGKQLDTTGLLVVVFRAPQLCVWTREFETQTWVVNHLGHVEPVYNRRCPESTLGCQCPCSSLSLIDTM